MCNELDAQTALLAKLEGINIDTAKARINQYAGSSMSLLDAVRALIKAYYLKNPGFVIPNGQQTTSSSANDFELPLPSPKEESKFQDGQSTKTKQDLK